MAGSGLSGPFELSQLNSCEDILSFSTPYQQDVSISPFTGKYEYNTQEVMGLRLAGNGQNIEMPAYKDLPYPDLPHLYTIWGDITSAHRFSSITHSGRAGKVSFDLSPVFNYDGSYFVIKTEEGSFPEGVQNNPSAVPSRTWGRGEYLLYQKEQNNFSLIAANPMNTDTWQWNGSSWQGYGFEKISSPILNIQGQPSVLISYVSSVLSNLNFIAIKNLITGQNEILYQGPDLRSTPPVISKDGSKVVFLTGVAGTNYNIIYMQKINNVWSSEIVAQETTSQEIYCLSVCDNFPIVVSGRATPTRLRIYMKISGTWQEHQILNPYNYFTGTTGTTSAAKRVDISPDGCKIMAVYYDDRWGTTGQFTSPNYGTVHIYQYDKNSQSWFGLTRLLDTTSALLNVDLSWDCSNLLTSRVIYNINGYITTVRRTKFTEV